jgi:hypothetical protein
VRVRAERGRWALHAYLVWEGDTRGVSETGRSVRETCGATEGTVLAELEVVMPPQTPLQLVHDVSLHLQSKVEKVRVERERGASLRVL